MAFTGNALDELRATESLINMARVALDSGEIDEMLAVRDILAARIEQRQADRDRRRASGRRATR